MTDIVGREFAFEVESELELVWDALTTADGLATWYVDNAEIDASPGGELKVDWGTGPYAMGSFEVVEAPHRLKLVYGGDQVGAEEWLLSHEDGVTHVRLIHSLPVEEGSTWDEQYGDITRGWKLFHGTLMWVARTIGRLGRRTEVRLGDIADGAWRRVIEELGLPSTPDANEKIALDGLPPADVLVAVDDYSLLLAFDDEVTLLVDVEGSSLYTVAATYGDETERSAALRSSIAELAERLCKAAGG
jgi:uncharacterized protein YndB with AHSA1/START domain